MEHNDLFICECNNTEHQMIFLYDDTDENYSNVYVSVHLSQYLNFWGRLKNAVKYVFGKRSKYGDFDEFIFKPRDYKRLQKIATYLKITYDKTKENG